MGEQGLVEEALALVRAAVQCSILAVGNKKREDIPGWGTVEDSTAGSFLGSAEKTPRAVCEADKPLAEVGAQRSLG